MPAVVFRGLLVTDLDPDGLAARWNAAQQRHGPRLGEQPRPGDRIVKVSGHETLLAEELVKPRTTNNNAWKLRVVRPQGWQLFTAQVLGISQLITAHRERSLFGNSEPHSRDVGEGVPTSMMEELKSVKVEAPLYHALALLFLQASRVGGSWDLFAPLPATIFQLLNYLAGMDYGTLAVGACCAFARSPRRDPPWGRP